ncbi:MAG: RNA 2',3'-cyclic phosphodiesterase [Thermoproteota archaeon]|nr:RNA 2',3'-cyclic phosphodiesterase [Thermoproteota archaeon]
MSIRSFLSIDVSITDKISELQNKIMSEWKWDIRQIKPVEKQNLHFSLVFLGEISPNSLEKLKLKLVNFKFESFRIAYTGLGVFPNIQNARVIWMGADPDGREKLIRLSKSVVDSIRDIGFVPDKPFIPHVTLFRLKDTRLRVQNMLRKYDNVSFGSDLVNRIILKGSELTRSGPIYSDIFIVSGR